MAEAALALRGVSAGYGETVVLEAVDMVLGRGERLSVIGRNGVGKTTLFATIMGHTRLHAGRIELLGHPIERSPIHRRALAGLGYVPQEREIFPSLTVMENLQVGARPGPWTVERLFDLFPSLAARRRNRGNQLSGGEQQMLAVGRALLGNPQVLLLDEPTEGLAPVIVEELQAALGRLADEGGLSLILVEQNTRVALNFSRRCVVMDRGRIVFDGASAALTADPDQLGRLMGLEQRMR
jgi:branched-chain amino acid transport system ATP-binding protein